MMFRSHKEKGKVFFYRTFDYGWEQMAALKTSSNKLSTSGNNVFLKGVTIKRPLNIDLELSCIASATLSKVFNKNNQVLPKPQYNSRQPDFIIFQYFIFFL